MEEDKKMESKINESEKIKKMNKQRKIFLVILLTIIALAIIYIVTIIAGAILYRNHKTEPTEETGKEEIASFNSRLDSYIGNAKTGSLARTLCTTVLGNNTNYADDESRIVYIKMGDITGLDTREKWKNSDAIYNREEISVLRNNISTTKRYDITASYDESGLIMGIGIIEKPSESTTQNVVNTNNM